MRLIHVDDGSGVAPLPGAVRYEELLAAAPPEPLDLALSPDDLYVLYTGGTTGMPKGVLWRQNDIYLNAMGGRVFGTGEMISGLDEIVARAQRRRAGFAVVRAADARRGAVVGFQRPVLRPEVRDVLDHRPFRCRRGLAAGQPRTCRLDADRR